VPGQHGAALVEENWDDIAHFIVHGEPNEFPAVELATRRNRFVTVVSIVSPLLWLLLAALLIAIHWGIWSQPLIRSESLRTLLLVGYWWTVWKVLTWV
jgi:hypothetical protein